MQSLQKNQLISLTIDSYNAEGAGVGRINGVVVFVPDTIVHEHVSAQIIKVTKQYAVAKLLDVIDPSEMRVEPPCPVYSQCGGCALQHLNYTEQLKFKSQRISECFSRIGHNPLSQTPVVRGMEVPYRYRNKASFPIAADQQTRIGLYARRSHRVIDVDDCLLQDEYHAKIIQSIRAWISKHAIEPYDESTRRGLLRHIVTRRSKTGYLVCLVSTGSLPNTDDLIKSLLADSPCIEGIVVNINKRTDNVILSNDERLIYGKQRIDETILGLTFRVSTMSFMQVNPLQTQALYSLALDFAQLVGDEIVVDAYCGIGTMSLLFAKHARRVYGIECVPAAIEDALYNANLNDIQNVSFECAYAEQALPKLLRSGVKPDILLLDPPRKGCDEAVLRSAIDANIPRIVYVSCDPATLARDVAILTKAGYVLQQIEGIDMFCQTSHVETVVLMSRVEERA